MRYCIAAFLALSLSGCATYSQKMADRDARKAQVEANRGNYAKAAKLQQKSQSEQQRADHPPGWLP